MFFVLVVIFVDVVVVVIVFAIVVVVVYATISPFDMIAVSLAPVKFVYPNTAICVILTPLKKFLLRQ